MKRKKNYVPKNRQNLGSCLREIFTPGMWKKLHRKCAGYERQRQRWSVQPVVMSAVAALLSRPGSLRERFEEAREVCTALLPKRKRGGKTAEGFLKALTKFPLEGVGVVRERLQEYVLEGGRDPGRIGRHVVYGLDGSKQNLPRSEANLERYGGATKQPPQPQRQTVAAVALGQRMLWDWACGAGVDSERALALEISKRLPKGCLQVGDAGFVGYEWCRQALEEGRHVLLRVGANVQLLVEEGWRVADRGGKVWLWSRRSQECSLPPLSLRLIKLELKKGRRRKKKGKKKERTKVMWLLTDLCESALSKEEARTIYNRRYGGNEITFRSWKCTLDNATQLSRTPGLAEREGHFSLLALMVLQALGLRSCTRRRGQARLVSVAKAQRIWRKAARDQVRQKNSRWLRKALDEAVIDNYRRTAPKVKRVWPRRKSHREPGAPNLLRLTMTLKRLGQERLRATGT